MKPSKIILIGYRATGKSTVGRILAKQMGWTFLDMDQALEKKFNAPIRRVVAEKGWGFFREKERELLESMLGPSKKKVVVSTGGGICLHQDPFHARTKETLVVWLRASPETIKSRIALDDSTFDQRPPLREGSDTLNEVDSVLKERIPLYRAISDLEIEVDQKGPNEVAEEILSWVNYRMS